MGSGAEAGEGGEVELRRGFGLERLVNPDAPHTGMESFDCVAAFASRASYSTQDDRAYTVMKDFPILHERRERMGIDIQICSCGGTRDEAYFQHRD